MENKICPIMSRPVVTGDELHWDKMFEVTCQKEKCQFWVVKKVYLQDGTGTQKEVSDCAYVIQAGK